MKNISRMLRKFTPVVLLLMIAPFAFAQTIPEKMQQGLTRMQSGDLEGALSLFEEIIRENPDHGPARMMRARINIEMGDLQTAQADLEVAIRSNIRRFDLAWQLQGKIALLQHDYEKADQCFLHALENTADYPPAVLGRARVALFRKNPEEAVRLLQNSSDPESKLLLGETLLFLNRTEEARKYLESVERGKRLLLTLDAGTPSTGELTEVENDLACGFISARKGNLEQEKRCFEIAYDMDDQNPVPLLYLKNAPVDSVFPQTLVAGRLIQATENLKQKKWEEAASQAREILKHRPKHVPARLVLIEAAENAGNYWEALPEYRLLVDWLPEDTTIQSRLAILARDMNAYDLAGFAAENALRIRPKDGSLHYLMASILKSQGKTDAAIESCKMATRLGFEEAPVYVTLGNLYYEKMDLSASITAFAKAVQFDPGSAEEIASFALSALTTTDYETLRKILIEHSQAHPDNPNTLYTLGAMYLSEEKYEEAIQCFDRLEKVGSARSEMYYNLTLAYSRAGRTEDGKAAMSRFEQAKETERADWLKHNQAYRIRQQAREAAGEGNHQKAVLLYSKLRQEGTAELEDLLELSKSYLALKNYAALYDTAETILKISPYDVSAIEYLVQAASALGKTEVADLNKQRLELLKPSNWKRK